MRKPVLLVIGAGKYQMPAITSGRDLGAYVIAVDGNEKAPGLAVAHDSQIIDIRDAEACLDFAVKRDINGVVSICAEVAVETVAKIADVLRLPGISQEAARRATNKGLMREKFQETGVPSPRFYVTSSIKSVCLAAEDIGFPLVIKPVDSAGSRGVQRIEDPVDLEEAFRAAQENSRSGEVIFEEFMAGTEVTVESLSFNGETSVLAMSDKKHVNFPQCVAISLSYPTDYNLETQQKIADIVKIAVKALGIEQGPTHTELILTDQGPMVVEIAARGGGFRVFSDMVPLVSGCDICRETVKIALGMTPDIHSSQARGAVLRFFNPRAKGRLREIRNVKAARNLPGVHDIVLEVQPGDTLKTITGDGERPGYIIATGSTRKEAVANADAAEKLVEFVVDPAEGEIVHYA